MNLRIHTQNAQIGISQTPGQLNINQGNHIFNLRVTDPKIHIQQEDPVLYIDQSQCFAEAGLKSSRQLSQYYANKGKQTALRAAAQIADEGRAMANIQKGVIIPKLAQNKSKPKEISYNFDMIPKSRPEINIQKGRTNINYQKGNISIHSPYKGTDISYNKGNTNIYLKQKDYINIEYIGKTVDIYGG